MEKSVTVKINMTPDAALSRPVTVLPGVGKKRAEALARLGVFTVGDLLDLFPHTYTDMGNVTPISVTEDGEVYTVKAKLISDVTCKRTGKKGKMTLFRFLVSDGTAEMSVSFFNRTFLAEKLKQGQTWLFRGKISHVGFFREMLSPITEPVDCRPLLPVYPLTEGLTQNMMRSMMSLAVDRYSSFVSGVFGREIASEFRLPDIDRAYRSIHFPDTEQESVLARKRLITEELVCLRAGIELSRRRNLRKGAEKLDCGRYEEKIISTLPFALTGAQRRVIDECCADMNRDVAMARLVQGDVGSGKTAVAAVLICAAAACGCQSALMAPTEILANQHYANLMPLFEKNGVTAALLTGSTKSPERKRILEGLARGDIDVCIGTHALIQKNVDFLRLGLAVTDEQHRFGVEQRSALSGKGKNPHVLVMSATPIPRSMALILYGDLDVSVIDELPAGRKKISSFLVDSSYHDRMYRYLHDEVAAGGQAYVVCPLAAPSEESSDMPSAEEYSAQLRERYFPDISVGYIHGKMSGAEKDRIMREFSDNKISVLVCTTVVEVGVDVPNATVMIVENGERFGLSQLHQLRGRVGRGSRKSYCFVVSDSEGAKQRLKDFCSTSDGFEISRMDLENRGPGDFFGSRQHGLPDLKLASLTDMNSLTLSGQIAAKIFEKKDWQLLPENSRLVARSREMFAALN